MRELKFRIWDNHTERYVTFVYEANKDCYLFIGRSGYVTAFNCYGEEIDFEDGRFVVQQYTGLKDKNEKEIYEGDIIETMYDVSCFKLKNGEILEGAEPGRFMIEKPVLSKVKWSGVGFDLGGKIQIGWRKKDAFKVVGNVFENSNLLSYDSH